MLPQAINDDCISPESATQMTAYKAGLRLFNAGEYWHAHEQWEICWLAAHGRDRLFYQGIIQAAAALVHWQRGNLRGLRLNWAKGRPKLVALPATLHDLNLRALIADMDAFVIAEGHGRPPTLACYCL